MRILPLLSLVTLTTLLVGCNSNPYPKDGKVSNQRQPERREVRAALGIDAQAVMTFDEGFESQYKLAFSVPEGKPVVLFEGLPDGCKYDEAKGVLAWEPGYQDANDPDDASVKQREYIVTVILRSDADRVSEVKKTLVLKVKDTPRPLSMSSIVTSLNFNEGEEKEIARFTLSTPDFPNGPFRVALKNVHPGLSLTQSTPGEWVLKGSYGYDAVKVGAACTSASNCYLPLDDTISAFAPDGREATATIRMKLLDVRQDAILSLVPNIDVKGDMFLGFTAIDGNQEILPTVTVVERPAVGLLEVVSSPNKDSRDFESHYLLSWTQVPEEAVGNTYTLKLKACNSTRAATLNNQACRTYIYKLNVLAREVIVPSIARGDWATSEMRYFALNKNLRHSVQLDAGRADVGILRVEATSSDAADVVSYNNGTITIQGNAAGVKVATLRVINSIGTSVAESFLYEVLPATWSSTVMLGLTGHVPELAGLEAMLANSNREFPTAETRGPRALALRNRIVINTHGLSLPDGAVNADFFASKFKDIIVSTPKLADLPDSIKNELRSLGVYVAGRASSLAGFSLADFEVTVGRGMGASSQAARLSGTTTSESRDPGILSLSMSSECSPVFGLIKPAAVPQELITGVSCKRTNGGILVVLGFEWADLTVAQADSALPTQWFARMME